MFIGNARVFDEVFAESTISANERKITAVGVPKLDTLTDKVFYLKSNATSTGNVTLSINDLAATAVKKYSTGGLVELPEGSIQEGQICILTYDGTQFILLNPVV